MLINESPYTCCKVQIIFIYLFFIMFSYILVPYLLGTYVLLISMYILYNTIARYLSIFPRLMYLHHIPSNPRYFMFNLNVVPYIHTHMSAHNTHLIP